MGETTNLEYFKDKVAVITGGASGIGRGIARALAGAAANVIIADVDEDAACECSDELGARGARALAVHSDVRDNVSVKALAHTTQDVFGRVDLLFNNAGVYLGGEMQSITEDDWRFVMDVNLDGIFRVGQAFSALLRSQNQGGHIVNTASVAGFISHPGGVAYAVSKFGVVAYSEALRQELDPTGIKVSTLCPGAVQTNLPNSDRLRSTQDRRGANSGSLASGICHGLRPEEVGQVVISGVRRNLPFIFKDNEAQTYIAEQFGAVLADFDQIFLPNCSD
jgi:NAD(P)-dependent dehydrogenase (short-subunit alcohol dehydrogenase family)